MRNVHDVIREIRQLAKSTDVKVRFSRLPNKLSAESYYTDNLIIINPENYSRPLLLSKYFHEYAHIYCYRQGIWRDYHSDKPKAAKIKRVALRVERFVDKMAAMMLYAYDKRVKYQSSYTGDDKEMREFLENYYDQT